MISPKSDAALPAAATTGPEVPRKGDICLPTRVLTETPHNNREFSCVTLFGQNEMCALSSGLGEMGQNMPWSLPTIPP